MSPLFLLAMPSNLWVASVASVRRVDEFLQTVPEVQEHRQAQQLPEAAWSGAVDGEWRMSTPQRNI